MRRIWVYWFILILAILVFSLGIVEAAEYQCHVITDTGTYKIYKARWWELQKEFDKRVPQHKGLLVLAFSDFNRKEIWYSEDALEAAIEKIPGLGRLFKHPIEVELENVLSYGNLVRALAQDKEDLARTNERPIFDWDADKRIR
ncbi:MAG: hypothetical protein GTO12_23895 [Proteobacteria bacterium]|nr:hypothetical protein [Pseudomonadota bacterium]